MYTNGNLEAHVSALLLLGTVGLIFSLLLSSVLLFFARRNWTRYPLLACGAAVVGYGLLLAVFSLSSRERTLSRGQEKHFCELDCHIAYSVQAVERVKSIGETTANGEFYVVRLRTRFDETTIAPWRPRDAPLIPVPLDSMLVDAAGRQYPISTRGQMAWQAFRGPQRSVRDPLRPCESYERTLIFDLPADAPAPRLLLKDSGASLVMIGEEGSLGHRKTYLGL